MNRWCKHLTAVSDGRLNDAHARIVLQIELHTKTLLLLGMGNLCSKFGKNRSTNYVTLLSTDARRTDGRTDVYVIFYSVQCICIAFDRQLLKLLKLLKPSLYRIHQALLYRVTLFVL